MLSVFDAGHNLKSVNGSPDGTYKEWEFAQDVADNATVLVANIPGLTALKTKEANTYPTSLTMRTNLANNAKADLFLSIHSNAAGNDGWYNANGFGVYRYPGKDLKLAQIGLKWCVEYLPLANRGIKEANFHVLRETNMPALLFEFGFHTHKGDVAQLKTQEFRWLCAKVLVRTACEFLGVEYVEGGSDVRAKTYIVAPGDNMSRIATVNKLALSNLIEMNPHVENPNLIHIGDIIFLTPPSLLEVDYAILNRKHILSEGQIKFLEEKVKEEMLKTAVAVMSSNKYRDAGRALVDKVASYSSIFNE